MATRKNTSAADKPAPNLPASLPPDALEAPGLLKNYKPLIPDTEYLDLLAETVQREFASRDQRDALRDMAYWGENPIPHPAHVDFQPVHMGIPTEVVERVRGILDDWPRASITTTSIEDLAIKRAQRSEDFANAVFPALQDEADHDTWDYVVEDIIRYGRGYDELLYLAHTRTPSAKDFPIQGEGEAASQFLRRRKAWELNNKLPLHWKHLPARLTFVWYDDEGAFESLSVQERRVRDIVNRYEGATSLRSQLENRSISPLDLVYFTKYFNKDYGAYWVSTSPVPDEELAQGVSTLRVTKGETVHVFPNIYGRVPITETSGLTTSDPSAAKRQLAIFDHMLSICFYLDQLVSQKATAVRQWAWATPVLERDPMRGEMMGGLPLNFDQRPAPFPITSGLMHQLLPGERIGWMIPPGDGAGSTELLKIVRQQADLLGITSAVFSGEALSANGYLYNSVMNAIRSKYSPIVRHIKRAHRHRIQQLFRIVEIHGEDMYVYKEGHGSDAPGEYITLGPDDLRGLKYNIDVSFEDHLPTDDAADVAMALQVTQGDFPLMDMMTAREKYLRDHAPERTQERLWIQKATQSPAVEEALIARSVKKANLQLDEEEKGTPGQIPPEVLAQLPPALQQALTGGAMVNPMAGTMGPGGMGGMVPPGMAGPMGPMPPQGPPNIGGTAAAGALPTTAATPFIPGLTAPGGPPPPQAQARPRRAQKAVGGTGGRPPGQAKKPPSQPKANSST